LAGALGIVSKVRLAVKREFLGWDRPFLELVVDWLWGRRSEWAAMLVVVPTAQSGRRIRQVLAGRGGCLGLRVTTPGRLLAVDGAAAESAELLAWVEAIEGVVDWGELAAAFPVAPGRGEEAGWGLALATSLAGLRRALRENGLSLAGAARVMDGSVEAGRWRALVTLESGVEAMLTRWGLVSASRAVDRLVREEEPDRTAATYGLAKLHVGVTSAAFPRITAWRRRSDRASRCSHPRSSTPVRRAGASRRDTPG